MQRKQMEEKTGKRDTEGRSRGSKVMARNVTERKVQHFEKAVFQLLMGSSNRSEYSAPSQEAEK